MVRMRKSAYSAVEDVLEVNDFAQLHNNYGIDEEGPVSRLQRNNGVHIPENAFQPCERSLQEIQGILSNLDGIQDIGGILTYQLIVQILQTG